MIEFHHAIRFPPFAVISAVAGLACLSGMSVGAPVPHSLEHSFFSSSTAPQSGAGLGSSVAVAGGITVVGAPLDDVGGLDSGVVRIYNTATGALVHLLPNPSPHTDDRFGLAVAISGQRVVVGAQDDDTGANGAGSAYVFDLSSPTPTVPVFTFNNPSPAIGDEFGASVAISGALVVVGAPEYDADTTDEGGVFIYDLSSANPTIPTTLLDPSPSTNKQFGWSVGISGLQVAVGAVLDDTGSADAGCVYVYDLSPPPPYELVETLVNPTPAANDQFGGSVAIAGDLVVVGAPLEDTNGSDAGNAYVFDLASGNPGTPVAVLPSPNPVAGNSYGYSLMLSGTKLVVGAYLDDTGGTDSGRAYAFDLAIPSTPVLLATILNPTQSSGDHFGVAVAIEGSKVVVGAHGEDTGSSNAGSAYIFDIPSVTPLFTLAGVSPLSDEEFGVSVAISGTRVVVGAQHDDRGASNSGTTYVFDTTSATPEIPVAVIDNPIPTTNDNFGATVAAAGHRVAISAYNNDEGGSNTGSVYIYDFTNGVPSAPSISIHNPQPNAQDQFGSALAMSGTRLIVGAHRNDAGAVDSGSAYVYDLASGTPTIPIAILDNPGPGADDWFGHSVAISGDRVVVGAHLNNTTFNNTGSAYVYDLTSGTPTVPTHTLENPSPNADDWFGYGVAVSGSRVVAGASRDDSGATDAGRAYVYDLNSTTPATPIAILENPAPEPEDYFGQALALAGTRLVLAAPESDVLKDDTGIAYVYELASITPAVPVATLSNPIPAPDDWFGFTVAIDTTNILIGAPLQDGNTYNRGAAFYFDPDPPVARILVEHPVGVGLIAGAASINFGTLPLGAGISPKTLLIRNVGTANLEISEVTIDGGNAADFSVNSSALPATLAVDQSISLDIVFSPGGTGSRLTELGIVSNAADDSPFNVALTGQVLSEQDDSDGDGLNDVAELQMEAMGFDWQVNDEELVSIHLAGANVAGYYTRPQLIAQSPGSSLIEPQTGTDEFKVTIGLEKSTDLSDFDPLPMPEPQTTINGQGKLEFQFASPENAAFFRLQPR